MDTLLELNNFVQHPNFTYSKRKNDDFDDRVMSLIWALFILDPAIAEKYYSILEIDDQGRPLKIKPISDNTDLIKKSPIFTGNVSKFKKNTITNTTFSFVGKYEEQTVQTNDEDAAELQRWLLNWGNNSKIDKKEPPNSDKLYNKEDYYPIILF
jgi:hypothetical protein